MFALVDCNSFYASCEQVFRPDLRGKPVVVLSNNDGVIVASTPQAKVLGIPDFSPFHKVEALLRYNKVAVFSSNYALYGDISRRVIQVLQTFSPRFEVYSIDEAFLSMKGIDDLNQNYYQAMRKTVWRDVRIPTSVGVAPTKTLAKLANHMAKNIPRLDGVCVLDSPQKWQWGLRRLPVTKVWGVGKRLARRLEPLRIYTAWELANANPKVIRRYTSVCLERTIEELNGRPCLTLEAAPVDKKRIYCTRSFGVKATVLQSVQQAVALYASRAAEKLRDQQHLVTALHVFIHTSPFEPNFHSDSAVARLPCPTDDTRHIVGLATTLAERLYKPGHAFLKAGVGLLELIDKRFQQRHLFHAEQSGQSERLMQAIDKINQRQGRGTVFVAAQGLNKSWHMRRHYCSPCYTSRWEDIPKVKAGKT